MASVLSAQPPTQSHPSHKADQRRLFPSPMRAGASQAHHTPSGWPWKTNRLYFWRSLALNTNSRISRHRLKRHRVFDLEDFDLLHSEILRASEEVRGDLVCVCSVARTIANANAAVVCVAVIANRNATAGKV
jgi:hypothetical protein